MSTYNAGLFLRPQVDSIMNQDYPNLSLLVRDDGSTDSTRTQLGSFEEDPRVEVLLGRHLGLPDAYFSLLDCADRTATFFALADQDDIWLPFKLQRAVNHLQALPEHEPALYCARVQVVNSDLRPLYLHPLPRRGLSFANALVQNVATGATIVVNQAGLEIVRGRWPDYAVMHDSWLYLVLSGSGTVVYDPKPVILYRQHDSNAVGVGRSRLTRVLGRIRRQLAHGGPGAHGRQNAELERIYRLALRPDAAEQLSDFIDSRDRLLGRLGYVAHSSAYRQTWVSNLVMKALYVANRV